MPLDGRLLRKLQVLRERLDRIIVDHKEAEQKRGPRSSLIYDPLELDPLLQRWTTLHSELSAADPEFAEVPAPPVLDPSIFRPANVGRGGYTNEAIAGLQRDVEEAWTLATHPSKQLTQVTIDREGIFRAGQPFDAMLAISSIIRDATKSIVIIDGYIGERTLQLLSVKGTAVQAQVLTKSLKPADLAHAKTFVAQYGQTLEIRTKSTFHDRFVVVDDAHFYHFGASIKDAALKATFMFSRIEEPPVITALRAAFKQDWQTAQVEQL